MKQQQIDTAEKWSDRDATIVLSFEHTIGRQAEIRLRLIKRMETIDDNEKRQLYSEYCKMLCAKVAAGGRKFYGNIPSFD